MTARHFYTLSFLVLIVAAGFLATGLGADTSLSIPGLTGIPPVAPRSLALGLIGFAVIIMILGLSAGMRRDDDDNVFVPTEPVFRSGPAAADHATSSQAPIKPPATRVATGPLASHVQFYRLREAPFGAVPDPRFMFLTERHFETMPFLKFPVNGEPLIVMTGDPGIGKTTILRHLLRTAPSGTVTGFIPGTLSHQASIHDWILQAFGIATEKGEPRDQVAAYFKSQTGVGKSVLLLIDEAQSLSPRMLADLSEILHGDGTHRISAVLAGTPALLSTLDAAGSDKSLPIVPSFYTLAPLSYFETRQYINYRLYGAGAVEDIFAESALETIYYFSWGRPGLINMLCDLALVYGAGNQVTGISFQTVLDIVEDRERSGLTSFRPVPGARDAKPAAARSF